jgi:hypothetical protein
MKNNMLALAVGLLLALLCTEVLLRVVPPPFMADQLYHDYDKDVGWLLRPIHGGQTSSACLNITNIHVNSLGFRDQEWTKDKPYRIAVLGDSFMQGAQLPEGTPVPQVLESLLGVPVLNSGIDGFGTLHEYLAYKKYIAKYKPEVVLLFFYPVNDVSDNSVRLGASRPMPRGFIDTSSGHITVQFPDVTPEPTSLFRTGMKQVKTALLMRRAYDFVQAFGKEGNNTDTSGVYMPEDDRWREAWTITEHYLVELNREIEQHGGKLLLVPIPEYIQLAHDWEKELKAFYRMKTLPDGFSRERPLRRLEGIAQANSLSVIHVDQFFRAYRDRFEVPPPYFYYRCDGHWNPIGHFLAANVMAKYLVEHDVLSGDVSVFERNLNLSPRTILSAAGYDQIYGSGRFAGMTNIAKLVRH